MAQTENSVKIREWLGKKVFPLWLKSGVDSVTGGFYENVGRDLKPETGPRRAMVQGRQIYAFAEGARLGLLERKPTEALLNSATENLLKTYRYSDGSFAHAASGRGEISNPQADLYAQAFALFGLAHAFDFNPQPQYKECALKLLKFLRENRRADAGGFTETTGSDRLYQQNPHMHLFEATLAWGKVDHAPEWRELAGEIFTLIRDKLIDPETGYLPEHFDFTWTPKREAGRFYFEPGHQFEWSWLLSQAREIFEFNSGELSRQLYDLSEKHGLEHKTGMVYDEVWSDGKVKKNTSRFWPQAERMKAALVCGQKEAADQAFKALKKFLPEDPAGVWEDTWLGEKFSSGPYKASSLYHIINALSEYLRLREKL